MTFRWAKSFIVALPSAAQFLPAFKEATTPSTAIKINENGQ